jgi:hypothetical protein
MFETPALTTNADALYQIPTRADTMILRSINASIYLSTTEYPELKL